MGPPPAGLTQIEELVTQLIKISSGIAFVALLVMLLWAGIKFLTSGGEPKAIQSASQTVTWALLGMLFLIIAWLTLRLIEAFTGVGVTIFDVRVLCPPCPP